ncbi:MAG: monooxygenase [Betaproteobacteria bacterium]|nr:monooxygenase [Betaproteobacteria bacterium]
MPHSARTDVLIVGAGPVGLTLAMDLAWRGIDVIVAERLPADAPAGVKCGQISARSMEVFRRLGIARKLRAIGLPADYPNDIVSATSVTGIELSRVPIPARGERGSAATGPDTSWPTPEHTHRVNQMFFAPVLLAHALAQARIRILNRTEVEAFQQHAQGATATARDLGSGEPVSIACTYLVGCDGAGSMVRKAIGAAFAGTPLLQRVQSTYFRAPGLLGMLPGKPAWNYLSLNPRRCGSTLAVDGRETWIMHNFLYRGETDFDAVDRDWALREILGVGPGFRYELLSKEDWTSRRLVADKLGERRAFICGDAAHVWIPHGGYGMNAGIADAANLAWKLAAALQGWGARGLLDSYDAERQPITEQASHLITAIGERVMAHRREISGDIERRDAVGDATRARIGKEAYTLDAEQQCCGGLNFGYYYDRSAVIAYDGEPQPSYTMGSFTASTVPGCRAPHLRLEGRRSLYDAFGPGYNLLRLDPAARVTGIVAAAAARRVPLTVIDVAAGEARDLYRHKLVLVRPDQHVAWRGDEEPPAPLDLIDLVLGALQRG